MAVLGFGPRVLMITDLFNSYTYQALGGGDGTKLFGWHSTNTANASVMDIAQTAPLTMTITSSNTAGMGATSVTVPFAYKLITGDFDIQVNFTGVLSGGSFPGIGMLIANDSNINLHDYILIYSNTGFHIAARTSNGSTESVIGTDTTVSSCVGLRFVRASNTFTLYAQETVGGAWINWGSDTRTDLGSTIRLGLYTQNGATGSFTGFQCNNELITTRDDFENLPTSATTTGSYTTDAGGGLLMSATERASTSLTAARLMGVRLPSGSATNITVTPTGTNASLVRLAPDSSGMPGTWGAYGAALTLSSVGTTNSLFWVQCQGATGDSFGVDDTTYLAFTGFTGQQQPVYIRRQVVPTLSVLGSGASLYLGYNWGSQTWGHNASGAGDIDVQTADGLSFTNIVYPSSSVSGAVTTFGTVTLASGLTLQTKVTKVAEGLNLVQHTLQSSIDRWANVKRNVQDISSTSSVANTTDTLTYPGNTTVTDCSGAPLIAAGAKHTSGAYVGIIAGNGYDNDYCIFEYDYTGNTSWFNKQVVNRASNFIQLLYGYLQNLSTTDYTIQLPAGTPITVSYVLCGFAPSSAYDHNQALYSAYHDAYYTGTAPHNHVQKMLWATAHHNQRLKRHIKVEGSKRLVIIPSAYFSPLISIGDMSFAALGIGQSATILNLLSTLHALGAPDGAAATSTLAGSAGNSMDGSYGVWLPWLELFAQTFLGYTPDATAQTQYLATANAYADALNNCKLIPDATTKLAHFYSDLFSGPENTGFGDFEQAFSFPQSGATRYRWQTISGTCSQVGTTGGVTPHSGSNMAQLQATASNAVLQMMPIAVPPSKSVTLTAWVNVPTAVATGASISLLEYSADGSTLEHTTQSSLVTSTSGWQQISLPVTLQTTTGQLLIQVECAGTTGQTAYFDDVQCTMASPDFPGIFWNVDIMPPQLQGTMLTPSAFCGAWTLLNLLCLKVLLGNSWTTQHQTALTNAQSTFPAAFWTSGAHTEMKEDLYHWIRKTWITSWGLFGHFIWFTLTGQKIFSDADVSSLYGGHPAKSANYGWGNVFKVGWVANTDGSSISGSNFTNTFISGWSSTAGYYVNAGGWLWASDAWFHQSAVWSSVSGASANLLNRLRAEVVQTYDSHESINSQTGAIDAGTSRGYSANAVALATLLTAPTTDLAAGFFAAAA